MNRERRINVYVEDERVRVNVRVKMNGKDWD